MSDVPIEDRRNDFFGFAVYADALAELIDNESTDTPINVAISAPWGAGKTSVAHMIAARLDAWTALRVGDRPNVTCWFNAWLHDDAPHLGAAMAASIATQVKRASPVVATRQRAASGGDAVGAPTLATQSWFGAAVGSRGGRGGVTT